MSLRRSQMKSCRTALCVCAGLLLAPAPAISQPSQRTDDQERVLSEVKAFLATISEKERREFLKRLNASTAQARSANAKRVAAPAEPEIHNVDTQNPAAIQDTRPTAVPLLSKRNRNSIYNDCSGLIPLLRKDWKDIDLASCPQPVDKADGAEVSFTNDAVKHNRIWSM